MVTVSQLLDSKARDPQLRAFAYLQARFVTGARSAIDCLRPFFIYAIGNFDGQAFDAEAVTKFLAEKYNLRIPVYMLHEVIGALEREGCLERSKISDVRICRNINKAIEADGSAPEFSDEQIVALEKKLVEFAKEKKQEKPLASKNWSEALIAFFQSEATPTPSKTQNVEGALITDPSYFDNKIIGDFVLKISESNKELFAVVEKIYFGVLVHDFLVRLEKSGNKADYQGLEIIYDTTVLMRLLGTSGRHLRTATLEMHQTLQDLGCRTYYFSHTLSEVTNNLGYIMTANEKNLPIIEETQSALEKAELTIGRVSILLGTLDSELGALGVIEHPETYDARKRDLFQIDEAAFEEALKRTGRRIYQSGQAGAFDTKSLALIVRIREGKKFRDVSKSRAIFVTTSGLLTHVARRFLVEQEMQDQRSINPLLTVGQMTTVAWLANEIVYEPQRVSKELIANCFKASLPSDGWNAEYWASLAQADASLTPEKLKDLTYVHTAREIALEESRGHISLLRKLNMREILQRAEEQSQRDRENAVGKGTRIGRDQAKRELSKTSDDRASEIAKKVTRLFAGLIFIMCAGFFLLTIVTFPLPGWLKIVANFFVVVVGVASGIELFGYKVPKLSSWLNDLAFRFVVSAQRYFGVR